MDLLIRFRHGLGDAVQLTSVLRQVGHYHPDWNIDVASLAGKHTAFRGLCRHSFVLDRDPIDASRYARVLDLDWQECSTCYPSWPSTKAERCLLEVFNLEPIPERSGYVIQVGQRASDLARQYLESIAAPRDGQGGCRTVLIHYEGNTSASEKNIPVETVRQLCEDILRIGAVPVILDWDRRTPLADGKRIYNPHADLDLWGHTGTGDAEVLAALIQCSALMIGIDSGPLHVAGATATPTIGVWARHHPLHYFGHADNVVHLVPDHHAELLRGNQGIGSDYFRTHYRHHCYRELQLSLSAMAEGILTGQKVDDVLNRGFLRKLTATSYGCDYYEEHRRAGLDYLGFGKWQERYGRWLAEALGWRGTRVLDVGCACGAIVRGLGQAGIVVQGVDVNEHMIHLGREKWPGMGPLLKVCDAVNLHVFEDASWDAIHTAQVAEHWRPSLVPHILRELHRVTVPGGLLFCTLDTEELCLRQGRLAEEEDPTHLCIRPLAWWHEQLDDAGWGLCSAEFEGRLRSHPESFLNRYDWSWFVGRKR